MLTRIGILVCLMSNLAAGAGVPPAPAASQVPFAFVENRGQADASVAFIGRGPDSLALFRTSGVAYRSGSGRFLIQFEGTDGAVRIEGGDATGARLNSFEGADPKRWATNVPMLNSIRYRDVWSGVDIVFRGGAAPRPEFLLSEGASGAGVRMRLDEPVSVEADGSLKIGTGNSVIHLVRPLVEITTGGVVRPGEASYQIHSDGSVGITASAVTRQGPVPFTPNLLFSGYIGGPSENAATSSVVNSFYNLIVAGWAQGSDMPTVGAVQSATGGSVDAYVAGFSSTGGALIFCTYLGGSGDDRAFGVAVDSSNNIYVTGWTSSANFPVSNPVQSKLSGSRDAFIAKLNPSGSALVYSTYLGGTGVDQGNAIAVSSAGEAVVVGNTASPNLKVTAGAFQSKLGGTQDAFVVMLNPSGTTIEALTYLGGAAVENASATIIDSSNNIIVAGSTYSANFPTVSAGQPHSGGGQDGFLTKFSPGLRQAVFSTYFGGSGGSAGAPEQINCVSLRSPSGNILVGGVTSSTNLPVTSAAPQSTFAGGNTDGFFGRFSSTGALQLMSYIGGSADDGVNAITNDFDGQVYLAGYTSSTDFPTINPLQGPGGGMDAFVVKTNLSVIYFSTYLGGSGNDSAAAISVDSLTSITVSGSTSSANFPVAGSVGASPGGSVESFITRIAPHFTLALASAPAFLYDVWHDTGYNGANLNLNSSSFGQTGDIPIVGDWTGTGQKRIGIFRNGTWLLDTNGNGIFDAGDKTVSFGQAGDIPVVGDWTGTGTIKLGLFRQGTFILDLSGHLSGVPTGLADAQFVFGQAGDLPVVSDWNQTGISKVGVFRSGSWLIDYAGSRLFSSHVTYTFGQAGDIPVVGDWLGNGTPGIGVYRSGLWILDYLDYNNMTYPTTFLVLAFGGAGYTPLIM